MEEHDQLKEKCIEEFDCVLSEPIAAKYKWYEINKSILPSKLAFAMEAARRNCISFNLALFLTTVGLSKAEAGFVYGFRLLGMMLGGPFWGMVADKWHCHRTLVTLMCITSCLIMCSQPFASIRYGDPEINKCGNFDDSVISNCSTNGNCSGSQYGNISIPKLEITQDPGEKYGRLFFVMFFMYFAVSFFEGSPIGFVDTATIRRCQVSTHRKIVYGKQRMFAAFGGMSGLIITNVIIDYFPKANVTCYSGMFITYAVFTLSFAAALHFLYRGLSFESHESHQLSHKKETLHKTVIKTFAKREVAIFYLTTFVCGLVYSPHQSFGFLYLKELHATSTLLSLFVVVGGCGALVGFFFSSSVIKFLGGTWQAFGITFFMFFLRNLGYVLVVNPWLILFFQPLTSLSFCLFFPAGLHHLKETCPVSILTTMVSIFNTIYFGVAAIVGSTISGIVYEHFGGRILFMGAAGLSLFWMFVVGIYFIIFVRKT